MLKKIITLLFLFVFAHISFLFVESNFFNIRKININGNYNITSNDIISKLEKLKGESIFSFNINTLSSYLEEDVRIDSIKIRRKLPDTLNIEVIERFPVGIVYKNNKYYYIDKNLNIFAYFNEYDSNGLPLVVIDESLNEKEYVEIENKIKKILGELLESSLYNKISEIYLKDGIYTITLLDGVNIYTHPEIKTAIYDKVLLLHNKESKKRNLEYIDIRFDNIAVK